MKDKKGNRVVNLKRMHEGRPLGCVVLNFVCTGVTMHFQPLEGPAFELEQFGMHRSVVYGQKSAQLRGFELKYYRTGTNQVVGEQAQ